MTRRGAAKPDPRDVAAVQNCLKSQRGKELKGERCIGVVADPCLEDGQARPRTRTPARIANCGLGRDAQRHVYGRLRDNLDDEQKGKLRDMQRAWIESRDKTCAFYWDFFQGTMASPMSAYCNVRETARRAMFLKFFLDESQE